MAMDNTVTVTGTVGRDPEMRFTPSGQAVTNFSIAVNRRWTNKQTNQQEEATSWFDIVAWGQLGENVAESIQKGNRVVVTGRLDQRSWENQEGDKRSKVEIVADEVAPSLRWANAVVTRNERREGGGGNYGGGSQGQSGAAPAPAPAAAPAGYDYDEEPF